jgi:hypothetical protein
MLQLYVSLPNYTNNLKRQGFSDEDFVSGGSDRLVDALVAWGDANAILDRIAAHREAGASHVSLQVLNSTEGGASGLPREQWRVIGEALSRVSG